MLLYEALSLAERILNEDFYTGPEKLYHATYKRLIPSIKKHGLGGKSSRYKWSDSKKGVVYLATEPEVAESYAEANEDVPEDWLDEIIIFEVDADRLDKTKLRSDGNILDNEGESFEYSSVIPFGLLVRVDVNGSYL